MIMAVEKEHLVDLGGLQTTVESIKNYATEKIDNVYDGVIAQVEVNMKSNSGGVYSHTHKSGYTAGELRQMWSDGYRTFRCAINADGIPSSFAAQSGYALMSYCAKKNSDGSWLFLFVAELLNQGKNVNTVYFSLNYANESAAEATPKITSNSKVLTENEVVTEISEESTNGSVPGAKAVYDLVSNAQSELEGTYIYAPFPSRGSNPWVSIYYKGQVQTIKQLYENQNLQKMWLPGREQLASAGFIEVTRDYSDSAKPYFITIYCPIQMMGNDVRFTVKKSHPITDSTATSFEVWEQTSTYNLLTDDDIVTALDDTSTDKQISSAKAVYDYVASRHMVVEITEDDEGALQASVGFDVVKALIDSGGSVTLVFGSNRYFLAYCHDDHFTFLSAFIENRYLSMLVWTAESIERQGHEMAYSCYWYGNHKSDGSWSDVTIHDNVGICQFDELYPGTVVESMADSDIFYITRTPGDTSSWSEHTSIDFVTLPRANTDGSYSIGRATIQVEDTTQDTFSFKFTYSKLAMDGKDSYIQRDYPTSSGSFPSFKIYYEGKLQTIAQIHNNTKLQNMWLPGRGSLGYCGMVSTLYDSTNKTYTLSIIQAMYCANGKMATNVYTSNPISDSSASSFDAYVGGSFKGFTFVSNNDIVTSLDNTSTDEQVPSAKAVYDMIGDITSLINGI